MAFNFLGILNSQQLQELRSFLVTQISDINEEMNYLYVELNSLQQTLANFSVADNHFGGNTTRILQPTKLTEVAEMPKQDDRVSADLVEKIKRPFISTIKYKLERNEYKMKKLFDAVYQTQEMIDRKNIAKTQTIEYLNQLESMFTNENSNILFKSPELQQNYFQNAQSSASASQS